MRQAMKTAIGAVLALLLAISSGPAVARGLIRDSEVERTLHRMSAPIFQAAGIVPSSVEIYIIRDRSLNAFVAGGRKMFLHTGLLTKLDTPEELIGVIAHEAGHIAGGHLARRQIKIRNATGPFLVGQLVALAAGIAGGGPAAAAVAAGSQSALLRDILRFSRSEEASADQAALEFLARANIDPQGLLKVIERFRGQEVLTIGSVDPYVLTHPLSTQRVQLIERRLEESRKDSYPEDPERAYWHRRMRAKLIGFLDNPDRAISKYQAVGGTEEALYATAIAEHRLANTRVALAKVDELMALRPGDPYYTELKGQILFETGDPGAAVPLYREASALVPRDALIRAGLGRALLALNDAAADAEALEVLERAHRDEPSDPIGLRSLATAYARAGNNGMATLATAERFALAGRTDDAHLHARRASGLLAEGSPGWIRAQDILALKPLDDG